MSCSDFCSHCFFFFNDTATTEIYTLSLHDALPISRWHRQRALRLSCWLVPAIVRSEEHTSELQSPCNLVCRLLLEKKKKNLQEKEQIKNKRTIQRQKICIKRI